MNALVASRIAPGRRPIELALAELVLAALVQRLCIEHPSLEDFAHEHEPPTIAQARALLDQIDLLRFAITSSTKSANMPTRTASATQGITSAGISIPNIRPLSGPRHGSLPWLQQCHSHPHHHKRAQRSQQEPPARHGPDGCSRPPSRTITTRVALPVLSSVST